MVELTCPKHKRYRALRMPRAGCWFCHQLWVMKLFMAGKK